jgi:hypothetical protein
MTVQWIGTFLTLVGVAFVFIAPPRSGSIGPRSRERRQGWLSRSTLGLASLVMVCASGVDSYGGQLVGSNLFRVDEYSGTTSGVLVDLGSGPVDTGLISFSLDPAGNSFEFVDWDNKTDTWHLEMLINFPLLQTLGLTPFKMTIDETGAIDSIPDVPIGDNVSFSFSSHLTGGGTVQDGPFSGFTFSNFNDWTINVSGNTVGTGSGNNVNLQKGKGNTNSQHEGTIKQPNKDPQPTSGSGAGATTGVPEPSTIVLTLSGAVCCSIYRWRRRGKLGTA